MRQFSFQDYNTSKQSEINLESIDSTLSSCNNRNFEQQLLDSRVLVSTENNIPSQNPIENSKVSPKKVLTLKQQKEGKENISSEPTNEKHRASGHTNEQPALSQQDATTLFQEKWRNDFKENENHLKENWKKMNKINKMLEENKKKKANRKSSRNPLSNVDENAASNQVQENLQESPKIKGASFKGGKADNFGRNAVSEQLPDLADVYEENITYEYFEERPEQVFSTALIEPFGAAAISKSAVVHPSNLLMETPIQKNNTHIEQDEKQFEQIESHMPKFEKLTRKQVQTQTRTEAQTQTQAETKEKRHELDTNMHSRASPAPQKSDHIEPKENNKTTEKKVPIEERLRLREIEREIKLTFMREERTRKMMTEMKDKPQISENSKKIALNSRRTKENEEVLDKFAVSATKKSAILGTPKYTETSEHHNQSKMSNVRSNWDRSVQEHDKSIGLETDSNINLYKRNSRHASITTNSQNTQPFESYRQERLETQQRVENAQHDNKSIQSKENEFLDGGEGETSLHKQASDRLMQAMAKKTTSSRISPLSGKQGEYLKSESSVPLSPMSNSRQSNAGNKKELLDIYHTKNADYGQEIPTFHSVQTEQGSVGSFRTPKHIYLRMPNQLINEREGHSRQEHVSSSSQHHHQSHTDQKSNNRDIYEAQGGDLQRMYNIHAAEDYGHIHEKSDHIGEVRKKSTRQPTFGGSPSRKPTNQSYKLGSFESPQEIPGMVTGHFHDKSVEKSGDHSHENQSRATSGRPSQESLLNSLRLRQQAFGESGLRHKDQNLLYKRNMTLEEEKPWPEIDVYMRNSMWLSAKNSKVAAMGRVKENEEMRECTFHPILQDKYNNGSIRSEYRLSPKIISERSQSKLGVQRRPMSSYKELHANKLKTFDQQQTISITAHSTYADQEITEHEDNLPIDSVQQEGQRFVSL